MIDQCQEILSIDDQHSWDVHLEVVCSQRRIAASGRRNFNGGFTARNSNHRLSCPDPEESHDEGNPAGRLPIIKLPVKWAAWRSGPRPQRSLTACCPGGRFALHCRRSAGYGNERPLAQKRLLTLSTPKHSFTGGSNRISRFSY